MLAARAQQLVPRRDLDQDRDVAPGRHRHPDHRDAHAEQLVVALVEAEPIVLAAVLPALELHDELDALRRARRRDAEQVLHVDQAEPADLHVMPRQLRAAAEHERLRPAPQLHGVVGDEPVAADDEIERALALADAALPDDQHAEAEDVHQHAVDDAAGRQVGVEDAPTAATSLPASPARVRSSGTCGAVGFDRQLRRRREPVGDEQARADRG